MKVSSPFAFEWLSMHCARSPDAACVGTPTGWMTYGEIAARVRHFAGELWVAGVTAGDHVMIALPNGPEAVAASLAVQSLGGCAVEVSREWGGEVLDAIAAQTRARVGFIHGRDAAAWATIRGAFERFYVVHPEAPSRRMHDLLRPAALTWLSESVAVDCHSPSHALPEADLDADSPALLLYTSGSTGRRHGVIQTHRNIAANTRSICSYLRLTSADRIMAILPLYYCYGKSLLQTHLYAGGSVFLEHRFIYPQLVVQAMREQRCTGFAGIPLTFELLRRQVDPGALKISSLRYVTQAGGAMPPDLIRWTRDTFAPAPLFVMYGQTEATARLSYLPPELADAKAGSIGRGIPGVELLVFDDKGRECAIGALGHLAARGENVTPGYFEDPEATREILHDGWLWTGDMSYRDADGFIFIVGRAKDILKIRGRRISSGEIEQCLCHHPDVSEAAVVGIEDEIEGESALAFVVLQEGAVPDATALRRFCHVRGTPLLAPKFIRFESALPRTSNGKIAKQQLRTKGLGP
ncbi:MAG TPA: class I adenylate-forming enzyme family protein [Steroidobacteraceae bacterium]|jgi:long-chain acyl-CoA synthetase|nr:class I adenylate-forming enzyme family protein [Steroidobacteraceae bacterium]